MPTTLGTGSRPRLGPQYRVSPPEVPLRLPLPTAIVDSSSVLVAITTKTDERSACRGVPGDQVVLVGENDELYPVAQAELGQHRADVGLDRGLAEELAPRDLRVAQAPGGGEEHVPL